MTQSKSAKQKSANTTNSPKWLDLEGFEHRIAGTRSSTLIQREMKFQIEHALFKKVLRSGDYLGTEQDIAEAFKLSRMPVRDALRALAAQGLIEKRVGKSGGLFVATQHHKSIADALGSQIHLLGSSTEMVFEAQGQLLASVVELAIANMDDGGLNVLEKSIHHMNGALEDDDEFLTEAVGFLFHVTQISGNQILAYQLRALIEYISKHHRPFDASVHGTKVVRRHKKLLKLMREKKVEEARAHVIAYATWVSTLRRVL